MKNVFTGILLTLMGIGIVSCSPATTEPGANTATGEQAASAPEPKPVPVPVVKMIAVPAETPLEVLLDGSLSSDKSSAGDKFEASLAAPLVIDGTTVLRKGAKFHGRVVNAEGSGRVKGLASITLVLTDVPQDGKTTPSTTQTWGMDAEGTKKKDGAIVGGAAAVGTAVGALFGGKKGALEGAAVGAGAGTGAVLVTKGKEVELGPEARIKFKLEKPVELAEARKS